MTRLEKALLETNCDLFLHGALTTDQFAERLSTTTGELPSLLTSFLAQDDPDLELPLLGCLAKLQMESAEDFLT